METQTQKQEQETQAQETQTQQQETKTQQQEETQKVDNPLINIIMRQTDYSKEIAIEKLKQHNNDIISIVREYMDPPIPEVKETKSTSQLIYGEIRSLMGNAAANYRLKKETEERRQQMQASAIAQAKALYERQESIKEQQIQYHKAQQQAFREQAAQQASAGAQASAGINSSSVISSTL